MDEVYAGKRVGVGRELFSWLLLGSGGVLFAAGFPLPGAALAGVFFILHPEISFVLFLYGGAYKQDERIASQLPVDVTLFFGMVTVFGIIAHLVQTRRGFRETLLKLRELAVPYSLLAGILSVGLFYSPSPIYGMDKFLRFATITALAALAPLVLFESEERLRRFFYTVIAAGSVMCLEAVSAQPLQRGEWGFHTAFGSNYLALARAAGVSIIVISGLMIRERRKGIQLILASAFFLNLFGLFYSGSRAPVLALAITLLAGVLYLVLSSKSTRRARLGMIVIAASMILFVTLLHEHFYTFMLRLQEMEAGASFFHSERGRYILAGLDALNRSMTTILIGVGTGGFLSVLGLWDNPLGAWPHNIFLEILFENGVIGLFAFVLLTKSVLRRMRELLGRRGEISPEICIGCGLVLFMMINALFSLDLNGNRMLFTSFGLIYAIRLLYRS